MCCGQPSQTRLTSLLCECRHVTSIKCSQNVLEHSCRCGLAVRWLDTGQHIIAFEVLQSPKVDSLQQLWLWDDWQVGDRMCYGMLGRRMKIGRPIFAHCRYEGTQIFQRFSTILPYLGGDIPIHCRTLVHERMKVVAIMPLCFFHLNKCSLCAIHQITRLPQHRPLSDLETNGRFIIHRI